MTEDTSHSGALRTGLNRTLSVVSLNMAKECDAGRVVSAIRSAPRLHEADLFLFQEVAHQPGGNSVVERAARQLGYFASFAPAAPEIYDQGLALLSRYPLDGIRINRLKACDLRFRSRKRFAMAATVRTPWALVQVWNAHLDTRINAADRVQQIQPVIHEASRQTGPRLIGGDFNTNDLYWLKNVVPLPMGPSHASAIRLVMRQHGFEAPFARALNTFPSARRHLDWIFICDLKPLETSIEPVAFSDHNAIWTRLRL